MVGIAYHRLEILQTPFNGFLKIIKYHGQYLNYFQRHLPKELHLKFIVLSFHGEIFLIIFSRKPLRVLNGISEIGFELIGGYFIANKSLRI